MSISISFRVVSPWIDFVIDSISEELWLLLGYHIKHSNIKTWWYIGLAGTVYHSLFSIKL